MNKLIKALKLCAMAHGFEGKVSNRQFSIRACNIPTAFDIQSIVTGFTGSDSAVDADFAQGWITVFLDQCQVLPKKEIDWMIIKMALPYGTKI